MPKIVCKDCGKLLYHENETTLKVEETIHKKFCRKEIGQTQSYMHRDATHQDTFDAERRVDADGTSVLK